MRGGCKRHGFGHIQHGMLMRCGSESGEQATRAQVLWLRVGSGGNGRRVMS